MKMISPMSYSNGWLRGLNETRASMVDLQRQLTTGKKADLYSGLGGAGSIDTAVLMRAKIDSLEAYGASSDLLATRMDTMETVLSRYSELTREIRTMVAGTNPQSELPSPGTLTAQAKTSLDEAVALLNTDIGGRYLFSGRSTTQEPVISAQKMIEGDGARAGFRAVAAERLATDRGAADANGNHTGRLSVYTSDIVAPNGASVVNDPTTTAYGMQVSNVGAVDKLGAPLASVSSWATGFAVDFSLQDPAAGDAISIEFSLPDGTTTTLKVKAYEGTQPQNGGEAPHMTHYEIARLPDGTLDLPTTVSNFRTALTAGIHKVAETDLASASALAAANDFFDSNPPKRVDPGPPPVPRDGTDADTVTWYRGADIDVASLPPGADVDAERTRAARTAAVAKVSEDLDVAYGSQANEKELRATIKNLAVIAVSEYDMPADQDAYINKAGKLVNKLSKAATGVGEARAAIASQRVVVQKAGERNGLEKTTAENLLGSVEDADINEVAVSLLQLQTQLQGSYQVTAMLSQLSLVRLL